MTRLHWILDFGFGIRNGNGNGIIQSPTTGFMLGWGPGNRTGDLCVGGT